MAEGLRSQDVKKLESLIRESVKESEQRQERSRRESEEKFEKMLSEMKSLITGLSIQHVETMNKVPVEDVSSGSASRFNYGGSATGSEGYQLPTKFTRIEFPKFDGTNFSGWLYKCNQFFEFDATPEESKVRVASIHMEGKAMEWHQVYSKVRKDLSKVSWEDFVLALNMRFGESSYADPMGDLKNLQQTGTVQEYLDAFDHLFNRVELSEEYAISCFLAGLREEISLPVRMFKPSNLQEAYSLAKLQETTVHASKNQSPFSSKPTLYSPKPLHNSPIYKPSSSNVTTTTQ